MSKRKMNFILFMPDEMRAESVSCYGHPLVKMPNFDRMAKEGVKFEQCYVQHTVCSPSRCSMMTGLYPHNAGHRSLWNLLDTHEPSLFEYLKNDGYHIEWHGKNDLYSEESMHKFVDNWKHEGKRHNGGNVFEFPEKGFFSFLSKQSKGTKHEINDMVNVQAGIDFMKNRNDDSQPFFLYLPLITPHPQYSAPDEFHEMYKTKDIPDLRPYIADGKPDFHDVIREYRNLEGMSEEFFKEINAKYLGLCSYSDWCLGNLLNYLDESGLSETTTVIIVSDHGDWAGDYGLVEKWSSGLDDTLTRVPFIIRSPGNKAGHVVSEQVEAFDMMSTVLELAGIQENHTNFSHSLTEQLNGASGDANRTVFAEGGYDLHEPHCFEGSDGPNDPLLQDKEMIYYPKALQQVERPETNCRCTMLRRLNAKLIRRTSGVHELYDLKKDPMELENVYENADYANLKSDLENEMLEWYIKTADTVKKTEDPRGLPPAKC